MLAEETFWDLFRSLGHWYFELFLILLFDVIEGLPQGKALDLTQAMPVVGSDVVVVGSNGFTGRHLVAHLRADCG